MNKKKLTELEKEVLAVLLDWGAVGDKTVSQDKVVDEVLRRTANKEVGMKK